MRKTLLERFEEKYIPEPNTGCWLWTANATSDGYGMLKMNGRQEGAHRVSYHLFVGDIPEGMLVCHTCDTPSCVNPEHLFVGTWADNMADRDKKGRQAKGCDVNTAKLSEEQAMEIFHAEGTYLEVAKRYGIAQTSVLNIKNKNTWRHIHKAG